MVINLKIALVTLTIRTTITQGKLFKVSAEIFFLYA